MRSVFDAYKEISEGKEIEETIESEFSGSMQDAYIALGRVHTCCLKNENCLYNKLGNESKRLHLTAKVFRNVAGFHAERIHEAIKGAGTDDETLIQLIVTRSEVCARRNFNSPKISCS